MLQYIVRRLLYTIVVILLVTFLAYVIFFVMSDTKPEILFAGKQPTPEILEEVREQFGLDKPWYMQYGQFVRNFFFGDEFGWPGLSKSFESNTPVREELIERSGISIQLALGAATLWLLIGIPVGILSALKRRSTFDRFAMGFALFGVSAPVFWLGQMSLFIFAKKLNILPGTGYVGFGEDPVQWLLHMILPWFVLALLYAAFYARMVRGNLIETMSEDYIRTARAKGLPERTVVRKHGLRASLTPIVTMLGLDFALLIGSAVVTESVFNLQGIGGYVITSVGGKDIPAIMGITVLVGVLVAVFNLIVDIVYAYLDPRVRYA